MDYGLMDEIEGLREELKQAQLAYQIAAQTNQFKTGFLARTAHELRSPLSSLMGLHQLILCDLCESTEEERDFLTQAYHAAQKLLNIIDEIVTVAKIEYGTIPLTIEPIQLVNVFSDLYHLTCLQAANRNIRLDISTPDAAIWVMADFHYLLRVLVILIDTTISRMDGGRLQLSANVSPLLKVVQINFDIESSKNVWQESRDVLAKIPEITLQSFKAFSQTLETSPGMKFLLAQTLLDVMQGNLKLVDESSDNNITHLRCSLPLAEADQESAGS